MDKDNFHFDDIYNPLTHYILDFFNDNNNSNSNSNNSNNSNSNSNSRSEPNEDTQSCFYELCDNLFNCCCCCFIYE